MRRMRALALFLGIPFGVGVAATLAGCVNPNAIGVQVYGTVTGVVVDARTQKPIPGALVSIGTIVRTTDSNGGFVLPNVPQGTQTLRVDARAFGYQSYTQDIDVGEGTTQVPTIQLQPSV